MAVHLRLCWTSPNLGQKSKKKRVHCYEVSKACWCSELNPERSDSGQTRNIPKPRSPTLKPERMRRREAGPTKGIGDARIGEHCPKGSQPPNQRLEAQLASIKAQARTGRNSKRNDWRIVASIRKSSTDRLYLCDRVEMSSKSALLFCASPLEEDRWKHVVFKDVCIK